MRADTEPLRLGRCHRAATWLSCRLKQEPPLAAAIIGCCERGPLVAVRARRLAGRLRAGGRVRLSIRWARRLPLPAPRRQLLPQPMQLPGEVRVGFLHMRRCGGIAGAGAVELLLAKRLQRLYLGVRRCERRLLACCAAALTVVRRPAPFVQRCPAARCGPGPDRLSCSVTARHSRREHLRRTISRK